MNRWGERPAGPPQQQQDDSRGGGEIYALMVKSDRCNDRGTSAARRLDALLLAAAFLIPLLVYLRTLAPTVQGQDTGELTTTAHLLGIPHPTGYPLYMLLARAFQSLPLGSVAYRTNLFSAVCMAGMCAVLALAYRYAGGSRLGALLAAWAAAFMSAVWSQATQAEVYGLNGLLVMLTIAVFLHWQRTRSTRSLLALFAMAGLGLTHHRSSLFFAAPLLVSALLMHRPLRGRLVLKLVGAFAAPLLIYLYLPIRASVVPDAVNWGHPRTLHNFLRQVTAAQYVVYARLGPEDLSRIWGVGAKILPIPAFLIRLLVTLPAQQFTIGLALAVVGWVELARKRLALWASLSIGTVVLAGAATKYNVPEEPTYMLPAYALMGAALALGAETVTRWIIAGAPSLSLRLRRAVGPLLMAVLLVAVPGRMLRINWSKQDRSDKWEFYDAGRVMFSQMEPDGRLFVSGDGMHGVALYMQLVEKRRPGVEVIWTAGTETAPWRKFLEAHQGPDETWPWYFTRSVAPLSAQTKPTYVNLWPLSLPEGYCQLVGRAVSQVVSRPPKLLARNAPGLGTSAQAYGNMTPAQFLDLVMRGQPPPVPLGPGLMLLRAEPEPARVAPGQVFRVHCQWRCEQPLTGSFSLRVDFVNAAWLLARHDLSAEPPASAHMSFTVKGALPFSDVETQPLLYGLRPLAATPPGYHYEERVYYVAARDVPPGAYFMRAGIVLPEGQCALLPVARIDIKAR